MDLPSKEKTFDFEHVGETTGKEYDGRFTVLCVLNIGQKHSLALEKTRLLGNYPNPTGDLSGYAAILSTLRAKIVDAPEWWKQSNGGALLEDEDALVVLFRKVEEAEEQWKEELKKKTQKIPDPAKPAKAPSKQ
jgi:hypothetical protein